MTKRMGYRRWWRIFCRFFDHKPFHSWVSTNEIGLLVGYEIGCARCGEVLDTFHPELKGRGYSLPAGFHH